MRTVARFIAAFALPFALIGASLLEAETAVTAVIYYTARDGKGRLIADLKREDLRVLEDGGERAIQSAARADGPLDLGVLLDTSTGVISLLEMEAAATAHFFRTAMRSGDLGFAVSYNNRVDVLQPPAEDVRLLASGASRVPGYGRYVIAPQPRPIVLQPVPVPIPLPIPTPLPNSPPAAKALPPIPLPTRANRKEAMPRSAKLYDAVTGSVSRFLARKAGRNVVVILALADDANSAASLDDALRALKKHGVTAYIIAVQDERPPIGDIVSGLFRRVDAIRRDDRDMAHGYSQTPELRIARLAEETGGRVIAVKGFAKLNEAFDAIAEDLRHQQVLTYRTSPDDRKGTFRKLQLRTTRKDLHIFAPNAYFAAPPQP